MNWMAGGWWINWMAGLINGWMVGWMNILDRWMDDEIGKWIDIEQHCWVDGLAEFGFTEQMLDGETVSCITQTCNRCAHVKETVLGPRLQGREEPTSLLWRSVMNIVNRTRPLHHPCLCVYPWRVNWELNWELRWPRSTNSSTLRLYSFTPRPLIPPLDSQIPPLDYQIPPLDCQIPSLDDLRFLHSTTSDSFTRRPPNSSTLRLKSSTRRPGRSR